MYYIFDIYTECQTMAHTFSYAELLDRTLLLQFGIIILLGRESKLYGALLNISKHPLRYFLKSSIKLLFLVTSTHLS